jgi:hypothetical protein
MRRALAILLSLAPLAIAQPRDLYPADYTPSPCASAAKVCTTFKQSQFADIAALRGFDIGQEWVDAHWNELSADLVPYCEKIATCFAVPGNSSTFCNDVVNMQVYTRVCNRYPEGSVDREKCGYVVRTYMFGHDRNSRAPWKVIQECSAKQTVSAAERTLDWWLLPAKFDADYTGSFTVYALDRETRVPVQAQIRMSAKDRIQAPDSADGLATTFYPIAWKPRLVRTANAQGHRDVAPPQVFVTAPGYAPVTFQLPIDVPTMTVEMSPSADKLKRGKNSVTITALDTATGTPVEARVMSGPSTILGKTNEPLEIEIVKGQKRPEIWVTSLYDRYSDVVVAPAEQ